jgi:hypothetical protein
LIGDPRIGWALAGAALLAGWFGWGWRGLVLALSVIAFWLLLQFSRTMRVLRQAGASPLGHVTSAVMLSTRLSQGMRLIEIIALTRSLGRQLSDEPNECFAWTDAGGDAVEVALNKGRVTAWTLKRAEAASLESPPP